MVATSYSEMPNTVNRGWGPGLCFFYNSTTNRNEGTIAIEFPNLESVMPLEAERSFLIFGQSARGTWALVRVLNTDAHIDTYVATVYENEEVKKVEDAQRAQAVAAGKDPYDKVNMHYPAKSPVDFQDWLMCLRRDASNFPTFLIGKPNMENGMASATELAKAEVEKPEEMTSKSIDSCSWMVAIDSEHDIYLFWKTGGVWSVYTSFNTNLRFLHLTVDPKNKYLVILDKYGDVYLSDFARKEDAPKFKRVLGHCGIIESFVLPDMTTSGLIFTADRDDKIRCSQFPNGHEIQYYLLGHRTPVTSMACFNLNRNLISVSVDGDVKIWTLSDQKCTLTWNVLQELEALSLDSIVTEMKVSETSVGELLCAFVLSTRDKIPVFKWNQNLGTFQFMAEVRKGLIWWTNSTLHTRDALLPGRILPRKRKLAADETEPSFRTTNKVPFEAFEGSANSVLGSS